MQVTGRLSCGRRTKEVAVPAELRADVSAHGFWKRRTTAMFDIIIVNLDVVSYLCRTPEKALAKAEKDKKDLYLQLFLEHRRCFTPMVYSADRIPVVKDLATQKTLSALLSFKLKREYSELCGFLRARMSLAIVSFDSLLLRVPQEKEAHIRQRPELLYGTVMAMIAA